MPQYMSKSNSLILPLLVLGATLLIAGTVTRLFEFMSFKNVVFSIDTSDEDIQEYA